MPATIFSGNNVKALKSNLDLNGVTSILSVNADPASGAGVEAPLGSIAMDYVAGKVYKKTGTGNTEWQELGVGLGDINYIENPGAESGVAGWTVYDETDAVTFTDAGDLVTLNNHGLQNGQMVMFRSVVNTTGFALRVRMFVVDATTDTFRLATSLGGSAIQLTNNGTGVMTRDRPKLGTGGTPNFRWTRDTSNPLRGAASFNLKNYASPGSSLGSLGQGVSYNFTIDRADQATVLTVSFDYEWLQQSSGGISGIDITNSNLTVYIIQDPTGTPVVIQPAGYQVQLAQIGTKMRHIATFQTASNVTSYRLCLHAGNVTNFLDELGIDNVRVGPQSIFRGAIITEWQNYTSSGAWTTNATYSGKWRRVGGQLEVQGKIALTGTPGGGANPTFSLPPGLSVDFSRLGDTGNSDLLGFATLFDAGTNTYVAGIVPATSTTVLINSLSVRTHTGTVGTDLGSSVSKTFPFTFTSSDAIVVNFSVPVVGWDSAIQMSDSADTRVVAEIFKGNGGTAFTANVTNITFSTKEQSTHGAWDGTTFTAPVSGFYYVRAQVRSTSNLTAGIYLYVDGLARALMGVDIAASYFQGDRLVYLNAGQTATIRMTVSGTLSNDTDAHFISIHRLSGPSAIAASETVAASYYLNANQAVTANVTKINFNTKIFDTHGAVTTGASWRFTAPVAGKYDFVTVQYAGTSSFDLMLYKNGSVLMGGTGAISGIVGTAVNTLDLLAGDYIEFRSNASVTIQGGLLTGSTTGKVHIKRVGN